MHCENKKGLLVVLSAPSGCGKDTVFRAIEALRDDVVESVSATTRAPRPGEVDGVNYFFKTRADFEKMITVASLNMPSIPATITAPLLPGWSRPLPGARFAF